MKNKIFEGVLLASDYDGTITGKDGKIAPGLVDSVSRFMELGGKFCVSTGRTKQGYVADGIVPDSGTVLLGNGVMAYDFKTGKTAFCDGITVDSAVFLSVFIKKFPFISTEIYGADFSTVCLHPDSVSERHFAWQFIKWKEIVSVDEIPFPLVKIMLSVDDRGREVTAWLDENMPSYLRYIWNHGNFIEIISAFAGKGHGLTRLAEYYGISKNNVFAIGDGYNDIDMLQSASIGFSPLNSPQDVLDLTDIAVRDSSENAVGHAIEILETIYG